MRRAGLILIGLLVLVVWITEVLADGSFVIKGYEPKKFSIDLDKQKQVREGVQLIEKDAAKKTGYILKALVFGSADVTGISAENDPLSKDRAEPIAALLRHHFPPGTLIEVVPQGDTENKRQVRVEWKYVSLGVEPAAVKSAPETKASAKEVFSVWMLAIGIAIIGVVVALFMFWFRGKVAKGLQSGERCMNVNVDGELYSVNVFYDFERGVIVSPYKTKTGLEIIESIGTPKRMESSLRRCLKREEFAEQTRELLRSKRIKSPDFTNQ